MFHSDKYSSSSRSPLPSTSTKAFSSRSKRSISSSSSRSSESRSRSRSNSPRLNHQRPRYNSSGRGHSSRPRSRSRSPQSTVPSTSSSYRSSRVSRPRSRSITPPSMTKGLGNASGYHHGDNFQGMFLGVVLISENFLRIFFSGHSKQSSAPEPSNVGLYAGIGSIPTSSTYDPFENYRRNKGAAYIKRIRDGRRD